MATALQFNEAPMNPSGIIPFDQRVLVRHDKVEEKVGSIILPDSERDKKKYAQTKATIIAVGQLAWWEAKRDAQAAGITPHLPTVGDRVLVGRYTGDTHKGVDGKDYVVLNDADVIAFLDERA